MAGGHAGWLQPVLEVDSGPGASPGAGAVRAPACGAPGPVRVLRRPPAAPVVAAGRGRGTGRGRGPLRGRVGGPDPLSTSSGAGFTALAALAAALLLLGPLGRGRTRPNRSGVLSRSCLPLVSPA